MSTMPQVDISTGIVTDGPDGGVTTNEDFQFVNSNATGTCTVHAPAGQVWFSPNPCPVTSPPGTATVTAGPTAGTYTYTVTGCNVQNQNPRIPVTGGH